MKPKVRYPSLLIRLGLALLSSFYILFHGRLFDLSLFGSKIFWIAFAVSYVIAVLMVTVVHFITNWLDRHLSWYTNTANRITMQLLLGVVVPLLIDFVLIATYFYFMGSNVFENGFMRHDFPVIVCFVIILNILYAAIGIFKTNPNTPLSIDHQINKNELQPFITEKNSLAQYPIENIVYIFKRHKETYFVTTTEEVITTEENLTLLEQQLKNTGLCRINRSVIFNFQFVNGYENGTKRNTLKLIISAPYHTYLRFYKESGFDVTNDHILEVIRRLQ